MGRRRRQAPQAASGGLLGAGARGSGGDAVFPAQKPVRAAAADGAGSDHPAHRTAHRADPERAQQGQDQQRVQCHRAAPPAAHPDPHGAALRHPAAGAAPAEPPSRRRPCPSRPRSRPPSRKCPRRNCPRRRRPRFSRWKPPSWRSKPPALPPPPVPPGQGRVPVPDTSVSGAIRQAARSGSAGGLVVGDFGASGPGGFGPASIFRRRPARRAATCNCSPTRKAWISAPT